MKKMLVAALAAMTLMAFGTMSQAAWKDRDMSKQGQQGMYQGMNQQMSFNGSYDISKLMGKDVKGLQGQTVGTIKDFVIDPNGHIFALITPQDLSGKEVAVPFEAFSGLGTDNMLSLNLTKDQLANAPEFNQSTLANRDWGQQVYTQFGIQPRWSEQGQFQGQQQFGGQSTQPQTQSNY